MAKKKQFLQQANLKQSAHQGKRKQPEPQTEDDFLEAADEFEKSGGKWRAGDAAKAARFFQRAVDAYAAGLQKFPSSFDLAYNKALLEYQITQDVRIAAQLGHPLIDLQRQALSSHELALRLDTTNTDVLFNTAQTLSDLAEHAPKPEATQALQRAVGLMRQCLQRQVSDYEELQAAFAAANAGADAGVGAPSSAPGKSAASAPGNSNEEYAVVEEAVSERDILDSVFALTHMAAELVGLLDAQQLDAAQTDVEFTMGLYAAGGLETYIERLDRTVPEAAPATPTLSLTLSLSAPQQPRHQTQQQQSPHALALAEAHLAHAVLTAAVADAQFRCAALSPLSYYRRVLRAFTRTPALAEPAGPAIEPTTATDARCALADALLAYAAATAPDPATPPKAALAALAEKWARSGLPAQLAPAEAAETAPVPLAALLPNDAAAADALDAADPAIPSAALHTDALCRALLALRTATLQLAGLAAGEAEARAKLPQLRLSAGDARWRLRNAGLALAERAGSEAEREEQVKTARREALAAEGEWARAKTEGMGVGMECAEEVLEEVWREMREEKMVFEGEGEGVLA
ncbi:uncharacterized protein K452DRAFT_31618 [Aplosporella prunicola CBS 121167]|uniref:Uncharacterized protein n=1 Tax=Aplosporella prunicola CBS 121167 TaxID=1176127 RepID=A0A6A6BED6_9PEZI|nr:uncharacterized protein K452DRAFT_31618 [Aplosporella prunicola CBS 121167]KAF2141665.1 hypothetical protein K452DRAFT_31618 [Aplosporella prunicola CBS 121167]